MIKELNDSILFLFIFWFIPVIWFYIIYFYNQFLKKKLWYRVKFPLSKKLLYFLLSLIPVISIALLVLYMTDYSDNKWEYKHRKRKFRHLSSL